jgi:hypothetical protein
VTTAIRRPGALLAAFIAAALLLTGCGAGPNQAQSAAIVGDSAISLGELQSQLNAVVAKVPVPTVVRGQKLGSAQDHAAEITSRLLSVGVYGKLVDIAAKREGLKVDEAQVNALAGQAASNPASPIDTAIDQVLSRPNQVRQALLIADYARKYWDTLRVDFDFTIVPSAKEAHAVAEDMAAHPDQMARIVKPSSGLGSTDRHMTPAQWAEFLVNEGSAQVTLSPQLVTLFGARPGTVVAIAPGQVSTHWLVARVRSRAVDPAPQAAGPPPSPDLAVVVGAYLIGALGTDVGVRVNPRYGDWDTIGQVPNGPQVLAPGDTAGGFVLPVRSAKP